MRLLQTLALLCRLALAAPAPRAAGTPSISSLGALQALKYNNLGPENNGTAAVLIYEGASYSEALSKCTSIGETLYPLQEVSQANRSELRYQLDYLLYAHDLTANDTLWIESSLKSAVGHLADLDIGCPAYSPSQKKTVSVSCDTELPALCTSKVPPTTDQNRAAVSSSKLSVEAGDYTLTGYRDARSFRFLGVPFANPPVDNLRFAPPEPYSGDKELDATEVSASCIQSQSGYGSPDGESISEDCLYLNVYTPVLPSGEAKNTTRPRPVAVYLYGGAFVSGSASMIDYDGGNFASRNDVVVVTVNYRVGALGWLATGNLTTGSYGTRDQIMALKWVQKHIAAFGGDPSHVTIFGQSAGGQSVVALLSSSAAKGLFSGAIVQSAPVDLPWFTRQVYADLITPEIAKAVDCDKKDNETELLSCLRSVPALDYLDNSTEFSNAKSSSAKALADNYLHVSKLLASIEPLLPVVDDTNSGVIDDQFDQLLAHDKLPNRVPTMFTTVSDEASLYVGREVPDLLSTNVGLDILYGVAYPSDLKDALIKSDAFPINKSDPDSVRNTAADTLTHSEWTCPQAYLMDLASGGNVTTHNATADNNATALQLNHQIFPRLYTMQTANGHAQTTINSPSICFPNSNYNATCHSGDVLQAWGTLNSKHENVKPYYSNNDIQHSQMLNDIFGAFFRSHDPNPDPKFLSLRGPAYRYTYEAFGPGKYRIGEYQSGQEKVNSVGSSPGWTENPGVTDKCRVFEEYGFTFENVGYTGGS